MYIRPLQHYLMVLASKSNAFVTEYLVLGTELQQMHSDLKWIPHKIQLNENDCMQLNLKITKNVAVIIDATSCLHITCCLSFDLKN